VTSLVFEASLDLGPSIDLYQLSRRLKLKRDWRFPQCLVIREPEYTPKRIKIFFPTDFSKPSYILSSRGILEIAITGNASKKAAQKAIKEFLEMLKEAGYKVPEQEIKINLKEIVCHYSQKVEVTDEIWKRIQKAFPEMRLTRSIYDTGGRFETIAIPFREGMVGIAPTGEVFTGGFKDREKAIKAIEKVIAVVHNQ